MEKTDSEVLYDDGVGKFWNETWFLPKTAPLGRGRKGEVGSWGVRVVFAPSLSPSKSLLGDLPPSLIDPLVGVSS